MKEFIIYTLLRIVLLAATFAIVAGIWAAFAGNVDLIWTIVIAMVISGVLSYRLLNGPRAAFAARVEERAARTVSAFEEMKAKEDAPETRQAGEQSSEQGTQQGTRRDTQR